MHFSSLSFFFYGDQCRVTNAVYVLLPFLSVITDRLTQKCVKFSKLNQAKLSVHENKNRKTLKLLNLILKNVFSKNNTEKLGLIQLPLTLLPVRLVEYTSTSQIVIICLLPGIRMKTYWPTSGGSQ